MSFVFIITLIKWFIKTVRDVFLRKGTHSNSVLIKKRIHAFFKLEKTCQTRLILKATNIRITNDILDEIIRR
jgi:hypothetical protein